MWCLRSSESHVRCMASDASECHKICLPLVKGKGPFRLCVSVCLVAADPCQWSSEKQSSEVSSGHRFFLLDIWKEAFRDLPGTCFQETSASAEVL